MHCMACYAVAANQSRTHRAKLKTCRRHKTAQNAPKECRTRQCVHNRSHRTAYSTRNTAQRTKYQTHSRCAVTAQHRTLTLLHMSPWTLCYEFHATNVVPLRSEYPVFLGVLLALLQLWHFAAATVVSAAEAVMFRRSAVDVQLTVHGKAILT